VPVPVNALELRMKILFALHGYKPAYHFGGPIISVAALAEGLVARGHEVTVYATNSNLDQILDVPPNTPICVNGVNVVYFEFDDYFKRFVPKTFKNPVANNFLYSRAMKAAVESSIMGFDLVHTHIPFIYPTRCAGYAAQRHGKPLFYHQRGVFDPARLKNGAIKKRIYIELFEKPLLRGATTLFALTGAEVESYRALGVQTPCAVIPNGIDAEQFSADYDPGALAQFGLPADAQLILFMSRIHPIKGIKQLLDAFLQAGRALPRAYLVVAGPDECNMGPGLRQRACAAGLAERIVFTGMVRGAVKNALLARADIFCLPSDAEGFSMAVLESLASGTAVQISPGCHFPEAAAAGAGSIVEPNPAAIAADLIRLFNSPGTLKGMGENGRALVRRNYSWPFIVRKIEDAYLEGLARFSRPNPRN
jgi:glycosyltransferase involved in cell wall biosynthesis